MELPKNITQIGEANHRCKIYVEDYVISYMKQLNHLARDKDMAVALYGVRKEEGEVSYLFLYGASKLNFLQKETRHLSQAQQQEIERCRERYFQNYTFLGYRLLNGEMIEGFHVCEQGICRYISGYAQFYEKNDSMLAYMLDVREEKQPEEVNREKYDAVKKKQEERRILYEDHKIQKAVPPKTQGGSGSLRGMRFAVVAVFAALCFVGLRAINGGGNMEDLQAMAQQVINDVMEQQIPDATDEAETVEQVDTLVAEDKLAEAILQENEVTPMEETVVSGESTEMSVQQPETAQVSAQAVSEVEPEVDAEIETEVETTVVEAETVAEQIEKTAKSYTIKEGDTLIGISVLNYGSDGKVAEICSLNQINNPDDIKVGQKILLP